MKKHKRADGMTQIEVEDRGWLRNEPGWVGAFTRQQLPGAIPNGSTIVKQNSEPGDGNPDGATGVVLGSVLCDTTAPNGKYARIGYFVEWTARPRMASFTADFKVRKA